MAPPVLPALAAEMNVNEPSCTLSDWALCPPRHRRVEAWRCDQSPSKAPSWTHQLGTGLGSPRTRQRCKCDRSTRLAAASSKRRGCRTWRGSIRRRQSRANADRATAPTRARSRPRRSEEWWFLVPGLSVGSGCPGCSKRLKVRFGTARTVPLLRWCFRLASRRSHAR
jgi:hypothetical protein